jgi:small subunit ribosomal protein S6
MSTREYDLVYVVKPDATEQEVEDLKSQVEQIVAKMGGTFREPKSPLEQSFNGRRKLAYEVGHHKEGQYVLHLLTGSGELMKELDRRLKNVDSLLRHLIVRTDEDQRVIDRARTKRQDESRRRRIARGLPPDRQPGEGPQRDESDEQGDFEMEVDR